jgi:RNA polymerase sigma-70 factor (ECF subfamily)
VYLGQDDADAALVSRALDGDTVAFEELVHRYQRVLFTVALRMLGDYDEANDATQNAFIRIYRRLSSYDRTYRFFSWAYRIVVNECLNARRARRVSERLEDDVLADGAGPADSLEAEERRRAVQFAILALPPMYRQVVVLRHFTGLSYEEISDATGVAVKTVKSRLHTARQRLARMLLKTDG